MSEDRKTKWSTRYSMFKVFPEVDIRNDASTTGQSLPRETNAPFPIALFYIAFKVNDFNSKK